MPTAGLQQCHSSHVTLSLFGPDKRGNVALVFGLAISCLCFISGGAADMARWLAARTQTMAAMDAAVLAGGRALQVGASADQAVAVATRTYAANTLTRGKVFRDDVTFTVSNDGASVRARGAVELAMPFLGFATSSRLPLFHAAEASEATTAVSRFSESSLEAVLVLDVSAAMCTPCSRMDAIRQAAEGLATMLTRNNEAGPAKARVGLVPFSGDVHPVPGGLGTDPASPIERLKRTSSGFVRYFKSPCGGERAGGEWASSASPGPGAYVLAAYSRFNASTGFCDTPVSSAIEPLTENEVRLQTRIQALATGGTARAGHAGLGWAYYLLAPSWSGLWGSQGRPEPFGSGNARKIAILLSGGGFNGERDAEGLPAGSPGAGGAANGMDAGQQALAICANMKSDGIEIFSVGLELGGDAAARTTLSACASGDAHFYDAADGPALSAAFRDIALKVTDLRLTN